MAEPLHIDPLLELKLEKAFEALDFDAIRRLFMQEMDNLQREKYEAADELQAAKLEEIKTTLQPYRNLRVKLVRDLVEILEKE